MTRTTPARPDRSAHHVRHRNTTATPTRGTRELHHAFHAIAAPGEHDRKLAAERLLPALEELARELHSRFRNALSLTDLEDAISHVLVNLLRGAHLNGSKPVESEGSARGYLSKMLLHAMFYLIRKNRRTFTTLDAPAPGRQGHALIDGLAAPVAPASSPDVVPQLFEQVIPRAAADLGGDAFVQTMRLMAEVYLGGLDWALATARAGCKRDALQQRFSRTRLRLLDWLDRASLPLLERERYRLCVSEELRQRKE